MANLWSIEGDIVALESLLAEDTSVDETGEVDARLAAWLEESEVAWADKVEGYCGIMGHLTALADARKAEVKRVQLLEQQARATAERMRTVLRDVMMRLGRDRVETTRYKLRLQKAGGVQPMTIDEFVEIPDQWKQTVQVIDKPAIRAHLESGNSLPFAALGERSTILIVK